MQKMRKVAAFLLCALLIMVAVGCQGTAPEEEQPQALKVPEGKFLPIAERKTIIPFQGTDLHTGEEVSFDVDGEGRVRMLSFFSPG
ncbi:MAG TPA: hypothetical protein GX738_07665 [Firmicutes bacterium]|nr:hypothetical protein [Bacillota bacterium]